MASGSRVSGPLLTAFTAVSGGDDARAEAAVAVRAAQLLAEWRQLEGHSGSILQVPLIPLACLCCICCVSRPLCTWQAPSGVSDMHDLVQYLPQLIMASHVFLKCCVWCSCQVQDLATLAVDSQPDVLEAGHQSRAMAHGGEANAAAESGAEGPSAQYYCERLSYYHQARAPDPILADEATHVLFVA